MDGKLGLWKSKVTTTNSSLPELSPEMKGQMQQSQKRMNDETKGMPSEQRTKMESPSNAATKRQGQPTQDASQNCLTKEKVDQGDMFSNKDATENCKSATLENNSSNLVMKLACTETPEV